MNAAGSFCAQFYPPADAEDFTQAFFERVLKKDYFAGADRSKAQITNPVNGSTFTSSSAAFTWNTGSGVSDYFLYVGSSVGANDIYGADQGTALSRTVTGIPSDGRIIYVRLWSYLGGGWQYNDYTYTAFTGTGAIRKIVGYFLDGDSQGLRDRAILFGVGGVFLECRIIDARNVRRRFEFDPCDGKSLTDLFEGHACPV